MPIIYTGGTFDLFHEGHVNFLKRCSNLAGDRGRVVVALNRRDFVMQYKGVEIVDTDEVRLQKVSSSGLVSEVIFNESNADSKPTILRVKPDYVAIGSDWARKNYYLQMQFDQDWLDEMHIGLIFIPYTKGVSSTMLRNLKNQGGA